MSDIPSLPYAELWEERTHPQRGEPDPPRRDRVPRPRHRGAGAHDGHQYPLEAAEQALGDLRAGRIEGSAVITLS